MNPAGIRRVALVFVVILWLICFWLAKVSSPSSEVLNKPQLLYKIRAYLKQQEDTEKVLSIGQKFGLDGSVTRDSRNIRKFMGYVVVQSFTETKGTDRIGYICEFLESKNFKARILEKRKDGTVVIKVGDVYSDEIKASDLADEIYKQTSTRFDVERYYKNTPYKAFVVVFQDISCKKTAEALKQQVEIITSDTEMVSY
jgi:hypothetical protein